MLDPFPLLMELFQLFSFMHGPHHPTDCRDEFMFAAENSTAAKGLKHYFVALLHRLHAKSRSRHTEIR